jgi:arabinose-5-phosphate isomerase
MFASMTSQTYIPIAKRVIDIELTAITGLLQRLDETFDQACNTILNSKGRVIVTGMGKSGHIGKKIAATFSSTGTPAYFVHPGEALHGDLGMITAGDVVITISNSGATEELIILASAAKRLGASIIAMTGEISSELAMLADNHLDITVEEEACPLGLAPTSSTTVTLVLGDALAIALLEARDFSPDDFARSHPAGRLGKRLLVHVRDIMHQGDALPVVLPDTTVGESILTMTSKHLGATLICDAQNNLQGIFTDGDLRRFFEKNNDMNTPIHAALVPCHYTVSADDLAMEALSCMQKYEITILPVVNSAGKVEGILHMHDLLKAGIV